MEVIMIDKSNLKLMLSAADLERYALDCDALEANDAAARIAFMALLRDAKKKCGFSAAIDKIAVRIFPSRRGGCELFVTALSGECDDGSADVTASVARRRITYSFPTIDALLGCCECLSRGGAGGKSSAYYEPSRRKYYLSCESDNASASEFGIRSFEDCERFLREHCRLITENAIEILSRLA